MSIFHRTKSSISRSLSHRFENLTSVLLRKPGRPFSGEAVIVNDEMDSVVGEPKEGCVDVSKWKAVNALDFGVRRSDIPPFSWTVIDTLRKKGFDAYLVGGCVRDLILKKIPKDFDVVTTANLKQVKKVFSRSMIVGKKFPICHVRVQGFLVEVSSFDTSQSIAKENGTKFLDTPSGCDKKDIVRWRDCMLRDFTINGLYYDPFANRIYDYVSGIRDIKHCKLRTISPAHLFLEKQGANVLRGIRIAARLGLEISEETAEAIKLLAPSVSSIVKVRLIMEMNYMMAYGAVVSSINLLQKYKVLDILLPIQATYLAQQAKKNFSQNSTMLMKLFSSVDKLLAPNRPSDGVLWVAVLAFHLALVNHPQDAFVVWIFASILFHGSWTKAVESVKNVQTQPQFSPEILESSVTRSDECLEEKVRDLASLVISSMDVFASKDALRQYMIKHPECPSSGLAFTSKNVCDKVARLFGVFKTDISSYACERKTYNINYRLLAKGDVKETRFVLGKVITDTMSCGSSFQEEQEAQKAVIKCNAGKHKKGSGAPSPDIKNQREDMIPNIIQIKKLVPVGNTSHKQNERQKVRSDRSHKRERTQEVVVVKKRCAEEQKQAGSVPKIVKQEQKPVVGKEKEKARPSLSRLFM